VRKILRERSRNLNREVWESPSVHGGEDVNESGTEKLKERERLNKMTEEEIDQAARSDPDALPVEDEEIWKQGRWVGPEPLPELVRTG
jgi:hypothetical protein